MDAIQSQFTHKEMGTERLSNLPMEAGTHFKPGEAHALSYHMLLSA